MEEKMNEEQSMEDGQREEDDIDYVEDREELTEERIKDMQSYPETAARTSMRLARGKLNIPEKYDTIG